MRLNILRNAGPGIAELYQNILTRARKTRYLQRIGPIGAGCPHEQFPAIRLKGDRVFNKLGKRPL